MYSRLYMAITGLLAIYLPVCFTLLFETNGHHNDTLCQRGQYLKKFPNDSWKCVDCERNQYMSDDNHRYLACKRCTYYTKDIDKVLDATECSRVSDSKITKCVEGFYILERGNAFRCYPCRSCESGVDCCSTTEQIENLTPLSVVSDTTTKIDSHMSIDTTVTIGHEESKVNMCGVSISRSEGCMVGEYWNMSCEQSNDTFMYQCLSCGGTRRSNGQYHNSTTCDGHGWSVSPTIIVVLSCISAGLVILLISLGCGARVLAWRRNNRFKKRNTRENRSDVIETEVNENLV